MPIATAPTTNLDPASITRAHLELFPGDISYDLLRGGVATAFRSTGIDDRAANTMLVIEDFGTTLAGKLTVEDVRANSVTAKSLAADTLTVKDFKVSGVLETHVHVTTLLVEGRELVVSAGAVNKETLHNAGVYWGQHGPTILFDRFLDKLSISCGLELVAGSEITINGKQALTESALGKNIKSSGLTRLGVLEELLVDGEARTEILYTEKLVIGADSPSNLAISASEDQISWGMGEVSGQLVLKIEQPRGIVIQQGDTVVVTFDSDATIVESDLVIAENIKVEKDIIGKGNIGVAKNLYVGSGAKINNEGAAQFTSIRIGANSISWAPVKPEFGTFVKGDIVYNSEPTVGLAAGWICLESGNPGTWAAMAFVVQ